MHIELTDHLRCPKPHDESYLILLPEKMNGRLVVTGTLACPDCGWTHTFSDGIPDFGGAWESTPSTPLPAPAVPPLLGIEGAGGWIALGGSAGALAEALKTLLPGIGLIAVNPPSEAVADETVQVIRGSAWPIKSHALRGAVLGEDAMMWRDAAFASLLPGRHLIGSGEVPEGEILGETEGVWVARL